jgi:hypothetical protein
VSRDSFWGGPLFRYTRADALRDGVLLDVTETAQTCANLTVPVAITVGLWRSLTDTFVHRVAAIVALDFAAIAFL